MVKVRCGLAWALALWCFPPLAVGQAWICGDGQCRLPPPAGAAEGAAPLGLSPRPRAAIVRISHECGRELSLGSGALVDANSKHGLVLTCGHLFAATTGRIVVRFPDGAAYEARLLEALREHDLAALLIERPAAEAISIASADPRPGERLVSAGYGPRGQFAAVSGRFLGTANIAGRTDNEVLEMSGASRPGDSGGPVLNERGELVGVQWGSDGRTVGATCLSRVRWFLARHSKRFRGAASPAEGLVESPAGVGSLPPGASTPGASRAPAPELADGSGRPSPPADARSARPDGASPAGDGPRRAESFAELDRLRERIRELESRLVRGPAAIVVEQWAITKIIAVAAGLGVPGWLAALAIWLLRRRIHRRIDARPPPPPPASAGAAESSAAEPSPHRAHVDGAPPALRLPEPIIVRKEARPPPQIVERDREFVEVQVAPVELRALQWGLDELVRRNPGARAFVETVEAYAAQYASGAKQRRAA